MDKYEAEKQLCKMQGEIAGRLGLETVCTCDEDIVMYGDVPDEVIEEMWTRLTAPFGERGRHMAGLSPWDDQKLKEAQEVYKAERAFADQTGSHCFIVKPTPAIVNMRALEKLELYGGKDEDGDRSEQGSDDQEPVGEPLHRRGSLGRQGCDCADQGKGSDVASEEATEGADPQPGSGVADVDGAEDRRSRNERFADDLIDALTDGCTCPAPCHVHGGHGGIERPEPVMCTPDYGAPFEPMETEEIGEEVPVYGGPFIMGEVDRIYPRFSSVDSYHVIGRGLIKLIRPSCEDIEDVRQQFKKNDRAWIDNTLYEIIGIEGSAGMGGKLIGSLGLIVRELDPKKLCIDCGRDNSAFAGTIHEMRFEGEGPLCAGCWGKRGSKWAKEKMGWENASLTPILEVTGEDNGTYEIVDFTEGSAVFYDKDGNEVTPPGVLKKVKVEEDE
jgi:hypothetical protein